VTGTSEFGHDEVVRQELVAIGRSCARLTQQYVDRARVGDGPRAHVFTLDAHHGQAAIEEDVELDRHIKEQVRVRFGSDTLYFGEESPAPPAYRLEPRQLIVECDAIDGSDPFKYLRQAFSTSITVSRVRTNGHLAVMAHMTVTPTGMVSFAKSEEKVVIDVPGTFGAPNMRYVRDGSTPLPGNLKAMAAVAARPGHADKIKDLWASPAREVEDISIFTVGAGNPAVVNLILDHLGWIYEPRPTVSWDLAALMALEIAGGQVHMCDGSPRDLMREYEELLDLSQESRTMPGYIAVSRPEILPVALATVTSDTQITASKHEDVSA
jgi:hypothetical protein